MQTRLRLAAAAAALITASLAVATRVEARPAAGLEAAGELNGSKWIVDRSDNICGLDDPRMLSRPAKVDYEALLAATPEIKKLRDDKVDPNSSEGIQLRQKAVDRAKSPAVRMTCATPLRSEVILRTLSDRPCVECAVQKTGRSSFRHQASSLSNKSSHPGLLSLISRRFQSRCHSLSAFSRVMASCIVTWNSTWTSLRML